MAQTARTPPTPQSADSPEKTAPDQPPLLKAVCDALALLDAINQGDLLAALPASAIDRRRHQTGVSLLDLVETRLRAAAARATQDQSA